MLNLRRRSSPRTKELMHAPVRIHVASQETEMGNFEIGESHTEPNDKELEKLDLECPDSGGAKQYLEHYFNFLHCVGLASFKEYWKTKTAPTYIIHRGLFLLLGTLAILDAVKFIKVSSVLYVPYGKMYRCVVFARYCLNCAKRIYFLTVVSSGAKKISEMLGELDALKKEWKHDGMKKTEALAFGIGLASILTAFIRAMFGWAIIGQELSPSDCVLRPSFEMSLSVFVWTTNSTEMLEQFAELHQYYAQDVTAVTVSLGIAGIVMEFLGSLLDNANNDIMLFSAAMHKLTTKFQQKIQQTDSNMDTTLKEYRQLQKASACIEEAFGSLFKISHATNLISCTYFLLIVVSMSSAQYKVGMILLVLQILKVWVTYSLAKKSSTVNKCFREWVRSLIIERSQLEYDTNKTSALLESSMEFPIGIGADTFFIDEIFLLKFATMVGTFSLFLINSEKEFEVG